MIRTALAALLLSCAAASAQTPTISSPPAGDTPATTAEKQVMATMMQGMDRPFSGNADRDFVAGMLPHHQGAVDMAGIELRYGRDPALRKLARAIIASQTKEQVFMRRWLAQHPAS